MILSIFSTKKSKDKILIYAFTHPEDSWYVRQMASRLEQKWFTNTRRVIWHLRNLFDWDTSWTLLKIF